jgi:hypothetical protein
MQDAARQYPSSTPAFNIDVPTQTIPAFTSTQSGAHTHLPSRDKSTGSSRYTPSGMAMPPQGFNLGESSEMDTSPDGVADQPSPATTNSQSRGGSTSHTSYSPGGQQQPYRTSPKNPLNQVTPSHVARSAVNPDPNFFATTDDLFSGNMYSHPGAPGNGESISNGFIMTQDWDMPALAAGAELPMSEGSWNQMLESINLGWDSIGPPHADESHTFGS